MSSKRTQRQELVDAMVHAFRNSSTATVLFHQLVGASVGLNGSEHKCLDLLLNSGPTTAGELADHAGLTTGAITGIIDRLEAVGFVRREKDPHDKRRVLVCVQHENAFAALSPVFESLQLATQKMLSHYNVEQLKFLLEFMSRSQKLISAEIERLKTPKEI